MGTRGRGAVGRGSAMGGTGSPCPGSQSCTTGKRKGGCSIFPKQGELSLIPNSCISIPRGSGWTFLKLQHYYSVASNYLEKQRVINTARPALLCPVTCLQDCAGAEGRKSCGCCTNILASGFCYPTAIHFLTSASLGV